MPSHQVEVAEAIAGIKRALKREREAPCDQPIGTGTNRGNKLKRGAQYVHEGSLACMNGPASYKESIEHAGYTRSILQRNPRRFNGYGEELDDSETDEEADADASDENAYGGIHLEELLCPLKHPSELPVHPSMSHAYLSRALPDMVLSTHEKLRQERASLWRAKHLYRKMLGDATWIPAGHVETPDDWNLFEPRARGVERPGARKRKRGAEDGHAQGEKNQDDTPNAPEGKKIEKDSNKQVNSGVESEEKVNGEIPETQVNGTVDEEPNRAPEPNLEPSEEKTLGEKQVSGKDVNVDKVDQVKTVPAESPQENGDVVSGEAPVGENQLPASDEIATKKDPHPGSVLVGTDAAAARSKSDEGSPVLSARPITRALTATNNKAQNTNASTPPLSPASSTSTCSDRSQLQIDPLYLTPRLPLGLEAAATLGLRKNTITNGIGDRNGVGSNSGHDIPTTARNNNSNSNSNNTIAEEILETRRLLSLYAQKQEESVRGYETMLSQLLTAQRLRDEVLAMCKAEEHVGELSDGEDWIDVEKWGLQAGDLTKGKDEDEDVVEENTIGGRKGKRRARN